MLQRLFSHDLPRDRRLSALLILIVAVLALAPFLFGSPTAVNVCARILVFIVLVASYDLILGYTGIISFGHVMFFGIGAYAAGLAFARFGASPGMVLLIIASGFALTIVLSLLIGIFSLRVKAIFFAMITLAVTTAFQTLVSQLSDITGGEDGFSFRLPAWAALDKTFLYYLLFTVTATVFLLLLRIVNSPFGRVLVAVRENEFRASALGFQTIWYRIAAHTIASLTATLAGVMLAVWLRYVGPDTTLSTELMIDVTLILVIGGMGTLYGSIVGAAAFVVAQNYLQSVLKTLGSNVESVPVLSQVLSPDRWLFWLGVAFILCVYHFPHGMVGQLRKGRAGQP